MPECISGSRGHWQGRDAYGLPVGASLDAVNRTPCIGFACWTMIVLFPLLYWVNGPAVSTDQWVVRTALIILAVAGALGSRRGKRKQVTVEERNT